MSKLEVVVFVRPDEVSEEVHASFYPNEVFITNRTKVYRSEDIIGRCYVAFLVDQYHTRLPENANIVDMFLCRLFYDPENKQFAPVVPSEIAALGGM